MYIFLIDLSWIFFRAGSFRTSIDVIRNIFATNNIWALFNHNIYKCGLTEAEFNILLLSILILLIADICKYKNIVIRTYIISQKFVVELLVIVISVLYILIFGVWGIGYNASNFIYFQF